MKRNLWFEEVILQLSRLAKRGKKGIINRSVERISKLGKIDERAAEIIRLEREREDDTNHNVNSK